MLPLETYAAILADGTGRTNVDWHALARARGVSPADWDAALAAWGKKLQAAGADSEQSRALVRTMHAALVAADGETTLGFDDYVAVNAEVRSGVSVTDALGPRGLDERRWACVSYGWMTRLAVDPRLDVYFKLRVRRAIAMRTRRAPRDRFAVTGPANLVRARRCRSCGALKVSVPRTAYVYCDFCATLFDYDPAIVRRDDGALDPDEVDEALAAVTRDALAKATREHDLAEYGRIIAWTSEVSTEVSPLEYSPRIGDPEYRRRFIHELIVPWTLATRFDETWVALAARFAEAKRAAILRPYLENVVTLLERGRAVWRRERELLERDHILERHPDGVDGELFLYVNASIFVRPWLGVLDEHDQRALLDAAGLRQEYVAAPVISSSDLGCGNCGATMKTFEGATRTVCESCGFVLEVGKRAFPCQSCGAALSLPAIGDGVQCGYCNASWARA